jgi:hypothetical protein
LWVGKSPKEGKKCTLRYWVCLLDLGVDYMGCAQMARFIELNMHQGF